MDNKLHLLASTAPFSSWEFRPPLTFVGGLPHIHFKLVSVGERERRNSEGWEKYEITNTLLCHKEYESFDRAYLDYSSLYLKLKNAPSSFLEIEVLFYSENIICDKIDTEEVLLDWY